VAEQEAQQWTRCLPETATSEHILGI